MQSSLRVGRVKKIIEVIERRKRKERKYGRKDDDVAGIKLYIL